MLSLAQPRDNARALTAAARAAAEAEVALLLTPELSLTGYSCEDLFLTEPLLEESREALAQLLRDTAELPLSLVVGAPWPVADGRVFNVALVLSAGQVVGAVPKGALPTYGEFYEQRWFDSGEGVALTVEDPRFGTFPLAQQLGFETLGVRWALELCEDLWSPSPPGVAHALAGAQLIRIPRRVPKGWGRPPTAGIWCAWPAASAFAATSMPEPVPLNRARIWSMAVTSWPRKPGRCWGKGSASPLTARP